MSKLRANLVAALAAVLFTGVSLATSGAISGAAFLVGVGFAIYASGKDEPSPPDHIDRLDRLINRHPEVFKS